MIDPAVLLAAYDAQVRTATSERMPAGVTIDWDGPLLRVAGLPASPIGGFVSYRDLAGVRGPGLDLLIERTCAYFDARGESFEWKTHGHDEPSDLPERLRAAGFVAEDTETVFVGMAVELTNEPVLPDGIRIRELSDPDDLRGVAALESEIWGQDWGWLAEDLMSRRAADPVNLRIFAACAGPTLVSAGWLVGNPGTDFGSLWGGSTLPGWRGHGIYRALIARRAQAAVERGIRYLQVDASSDSTPILGRLGFVAITTTTPFVHRQASIGRRPRPPVVAEQIP